MDLERDRLSFRNMDVILISRLGYPFIQKKIEEIMGPSTDVLQYEINSKMIIKAFPQLLQGMNSLNERELANKLLEICSEMGYGVLEDIEFPEEEELPFRVKIRNCFNTCVYEQKTEKPVCHQMRGMIAGIFELAYLKKMYCNEVMCSAKGDELCIFEVYRSGGKSQRAAKARKKPINKEKKSKLRDITIDYDENRGELTFHNSSSVMVPPVAYSIMHKEFEHIIGTPAKSVFYNVAKEASIDVVGKAKELMIRVMGNLSPETIVTKIADEFSSRGMGTLEVVEINRKKSHVTVRIRNSPIAEDYGSSDKPICYDNTGNIAGGAQLIFGKEMTCIETKCQAMGDPFCEFESFEDIEKDRLQGLIGQIYDIGSDVEGAVLIARDGTLLVSILPKHIDKDKFASTVSIIIGSTNQAARELKYNGFQRTTIESDDAKIVISSIDRKAHLVIVTSIKVGLGMILLEIDKLRKKIEEEL